MRAGYRNLMNVEILIDFYIGDISLISVGDHIDIPRYTKNNFPDGAGHRTDRIIPFIYKKGRELKRTFYVTKVNNITRITRIF